MCRLKMDSFAEDPWMASLQSHRENEERQACVCIDDGHMRPCSLLVGEHSALLHLHTTQPQARLSMLAKSWPAIRPAMTTIMTNRGLEDAHMVFDLVSTAHVLCIHMYSFTVVDTVLHLAGVALQLSCTRHSGGGNWTNSRAQLYRVEH